MILFSWMFLVRNVWLMLCIRMKGRVFVFIFLLCSMCVVSVVLL